MLQLDCPWCGKRDQSEFSYGGEAHIVRPTDPFNLTDREWAEYLFMRDNPKGLAREQWIHSAGCRRWFNVVRDTVTYQIKRVYVGSDPASDLPTAGSRAANSTKESRLTDPKAMP